MTIPVPPAILNREAARGIIADLDRRAQADRERDLVADLAHVLGALEVTAWKVLETYNYVVRARYPGLTVTSGILDEEVARLGADDGPGGLMRRLLVELVHRLRLELAVELLETPIYADLVDPLHRQIP